MIFRKKKEPSPEEKLTEMLNRTLSKLKEKKNLEELSKLVNDFFSEFFNLEYNFTSQEFEKDLKTRRIEKNMTNRIIKLHRNISEMKYQKDKPVNEKIDMVKQEFRKVLSILMKGLQRKQKKTIFSFFNFKKYIPRPIIVKKIDFSDPKKIYEMVKETRQLINKGKHEKARIKYSLLVKAYNKIPQEEKKNTYFHMKKLYDLLSSS